MSSLPQSSMSTPSGITVSLGDRLLGTESKVPQVRSIVPALPAPLLTGPTTYASAFETQLAALASPQMGRIGVTSTVGKGA